MKELTCCFTGHRDIPQEDFLTITSNLECEVLSLISKGVNHFCCGGALGFDTLAAQTVLRIKTQHQHIRLVLVLPCKTQTTGWNEKDKSKYNFILKNADEVIYTSEKYYRGCMHTRNRKLVDLSSYCIAYLRKESGGTFYTVEYAKKYGLAIAFV